MEPGKCLNQDLLDPSFRSPDVLLDCRGSSEIGLLRMGRTQLASITKKSREVLASPPSAVVGEPQWRVEKVERAGPTHARELHSLAGLALSIRQGEPCSGMRLDFELSCGTARIRACDHDLDVTLRLCHVNLERQNCEVQPHSMYEFRLSDGHFEADQTATSISEKSRDAAFNLEASLGAAPAGPSMAAKIGALWKRGSKRANKQQDTTRRQTRIDLIVTSGQDRWQVGDARLGDARQEGGQLLGSYFGEHRDSDGDPRPLCVVVRNDPTSIVELTVAVTVPLGHLSVTIGGDKAADELKSVTLSGVRRSSAKATREHAGRRGELRSRVAGLVAAKALAESQRQACLPVPDGECIIALQSVFVAASLVPSDTGKEQA